MKSFLPFLIICILFSHNSLSQSPHTLVGKFHELKKEDQRNIYGHQFYLLIEDSKGKRQAYPVKLNEKNKEKMIKEIRQNKGEQFIVKARPDSVQIKPRLGSEVTSQIVQLQISEVKMLNLKSLGYGKMKPYEPKGFPISRDKNVKVTSPNRVTISGVNDTFTNAAIATGAAVLLGSILLGK